MKQTIVAAALAAFVAALVASLVTANRHAPRAEVTAHAPALPAARPASADVAELGERIDALALTIANQRRELEQRIDALARRPAEVAPAAAPEAVAPSPATPASGGSRAEELARLPIDELFRLLWAGGVTDEETLWNEIAKLGRTKDLVALFEAEAAKSPNDPDVAVKLGSAYIRMIQEVGAGPLAGAWATKADQAFDRALALDENHVGARFSKAISLSFWPPIFGKQPEAIRQFEILIGNLKDQPLEPGHAQAWLMLGNLHSQSGKAAEAKAIWEQGAALFPHDPSFASKLGH